MLCAIAGVTAHKTELRRHFRRLRVQQLPKLQQRLDRGGASLLTALLLQATSPERHLGLTWPLPGEPDLRPWLSASGWPLALPAVAAGRLVYRAWQPGMELTPDECGIAAPTASSPDLQPGQLALLLVPALAIDRRGVRLGYGGGWYDRLRADPQWQRVPAVAVLPAACVCDRLPCDPWDVPFAGWLDENGCQWIGPSPTQHPLI